MKQNQQAQGLGVVLLNKKFVNKYFRSPKNKGRDLFLAKNVAGNTFRTIHL